ncbi:MAG: hypothetical protein QXF61_08480 [Nitrososphaeria archaeon]
MKVPKTSIEYPFLDQESAKKPILVQPAPGKGLGKPRKKRIFIAVLFMLVLVVGGFLPHLQGFLVTEVFSYVFVCVFAYLFQWFRLT